MAANPLRVNLTFNTIQKAIGWTDCAKAAICRPASRGFQERRQYRKIIFAVGVVEKAILRWRMKGKGFCGVQVLDEATEDPEQEGEVEEFFKASRKQAEEHIERSVVRVQAMFHSKRAQEDYSRMKLAHNKANIEYEGLLNTDTEMG
ncbi:calmodulin-binding transcription activator 6-like [Apium graveolens]|uniref:calmodulin-binding transcription activator 6-like n=1 Tax=Apium graveolens TaxID=4045 RepID=UPI003D7A3994